MNTNKVEMNASALTSKSGTFFKGRDTGIFGTPNKNLFSD